MLLGSGCLIKHPVDCIAATRAEVLESFLVIPGHVRFAVAMSSNSYVSPDRFFLFLSMDTIFKVATIGMRANCSRPKTKVIMQAGQRDFRTAFCALHHLGFFLFFFCSFFLLSFSSSSDFAFSYVLSITHLGIEASQQPWLKIVHVFYRNVHVQERVWQKRLSYFL
jgi:hypothetical protein